MAKAQYNMRRFDDSTTLVVTIHITREFRLRMWLAVQCLRLAAWLMNCRYRMEASNG